MIERMIQTKRFYQRRPDNIMVQNTSSGLSVQKEFEIYED